MTSNEELRLQAEHTSMRNYRPAPMVLTRGEGRHVWDVEGTRFLDLTGGIAVLSVGHAHPRLARDIAKQSARLVHTSNLFYNDRAIELSRRIVAKTGFSRVYFGNSGTEANEALMKLSRRWHWERGHQERVEFVATHRSFHGRSMGALSVTGQSKYHLGMEPLLPGVRFVEYDDIEAMRQVVGERTAAVIVEPIQAEGGVRVPENAYLVALRQLCDERGALLMFDEVQTGYGRTGRFLCREHSGVMPDACSLAKGIAGGFPLSAMAVTLKVEGGLPPGSHASTFGGNPLACAAGLAVLDIFEEEDLVERSEVQGRYLGQHLNRLVDKSDVFVDARGRGLLRGLELADGIDPAGMIAALRKRRVLLTLAGGNVLRFVPALNVTREELDEGLAAIEDILLDPPLLQGTSS
ncbi:MAG: aspartate aminotransferase family protein [Myxococcota bacterium]